MPMYEHVCQNNSCKYEWEDQYSIKQEPPKICPKCHQETAMRVISLSGKGVVELYGQDLVSKCLSDAQKIKNEAHQNANKYANLLGEDRYNKIQTSMDRRPKRK